MQGPRRADDSLWPPATSSGSGNDTLELILAVALLGGRRAECADWGFAQLLCKLSATRKPFAPDQLSGSFVE